MSTVTLHGRYYDGRAPVGSAATLVFAGPRAALISAQHSQEYATGTLLVSPRIGTAERFIQFPDGGQFQCPDDRTLDRLPHESQAEGLVAWLEARAAVAIAGVVVIVALVAAGYFLGLPAAAERLVDHIPIETEQALGRQALTWLDEHQWLKPSKVDEDLRYFIEKDFDELRKGLTHESAQRLEFRDAGFFGANAFAFPGGTVVITDDMVHEAESLDEIIAVLAHELGHVERRHALRQLLHDSAVAIVATTLTADAASLTVAVAGLPTVLAQAKYSRTFESEADDFAFDLLRRRGRSPEAFATLMERLMGEDEDSERQFAFLSSHPMTRERVERARAAAKP